MWAPIHETPIDSAAKILDNMFESMVVIESGLLTEASKESCGKSNVDATDNIGIHDFAKDLAIGEASFEFNCLMLASGFSRTGDGL